MTGDEYSAKLEKALEGLPPEFAQFVRGNAYERGHSAGYEEVLGIAQSLASDLKPVIEQYRLSIDRTLSDYGLWLLNKGDKHGWSVMDEAGHRVRRDR